MSDKQNFQAEGIMEKGYGFIPKLVMKDKELTIEAKAIYAYLSSYTGAGNTAYPSVSLMCGDLDISERRFYKHRKLLVESGYIVIEKKRNEGGWSNNVYRLPFKPHLRNVSIQNVSTQNVSTQNGSAKSNSLKSNSIKSNSCSSSDDENFIELAKAFEQNGFGTISSYVRDTLSSLSEEYTSEWVLDAIKLAVDSNVRNLRYVEGILKSWQSKGKDDGIGSKKDKVTNGWAVDAT